MEPKFKDKSIKFFFFFDENKGFKLIRPFSVFGFFFLIQFLLAVHGWIEERHSSIVHHLVLESL
jgi:hypothetical protein